MPSPSADGARAAVPTSVRPTPPSAVMIFLELQNSTSTQPRTDLPKTTLDPPNPDRSSESYANAAVAVRGARERGAAARGAGAERRGAVRRVFGGLDERPGPVVVLRAACGAFSIAPVEKM